MIMALILILKMLNMAKYLKINQKNQVNLLKVIYLK